MPGASKNYYSSDAPSYSTSPKKKRPQDTSGSGITGALDDLAERLRSNRERRALEELKRRGEET